MSTRSPLVLLFALLTLFVNTLNVGAQRYTTTLPWIDGDTIIVSQSTNAAGVTLEIETLSTIAAITTGLVRTTTTPGALLTTTTPLVPTTTSIPLVATTTTTPLVPTTTTTPVRVTTDLDEETTTSRRRTSTSIAIVATPTVAPGEVNPVPAGTIMDYSEYQSSLNQAAKTGGIKSALNGGSNGAGSLKVDLGLGMGLTVLGGVVVGVVGLF